MGVTGSQTGNTTALSTASPPGGSEAVLSAESAARGLSNVLGQAVPWYVSRLAAAVAQAYAAAGGSYAVAYSRAVAATLAAFSQAQSLQQQGQHGYFGGNEWGYYGYATSPNDPNGTFVGLSLELPVPAGPQPGFAAPQFPGAPEMPSFPGLPAPQGGAAQAQGGGGNEAPSPWQEPKAVTLSDQLAAVPRPHDPTPGGGAIPELRRQMRNLTKRGRLS